MNRHKFIIIISFLLIILSCTPSCLYALEYPELNSEIVEIYDLTDEKIIYEVDSQKVTSIASLTKIVTTIVAIENIPNLEEEVLITDDLLSTVRWDASKAGLQAGDIVTYRDLLYASMLPSGADATNSIAILRDGSIDDFVLRMNEFVLTLGLKNTHFTNVTGLDEEGHYSTADDMRIILSYALQNELFKQIYTTKEYTLSNGLKVESTLIKYNLFSNIDTSKILGSKTGYTGEAGYCLSSISNINNHEFIIIVLNAKHRDNQYFNIVDTTTLIDFLLEHYQDQVLIKKGELIQTIPVRLSKKDKYKVYTEQDITLYLPSDYEKDKIRIDYDGIDSLSFFHKKGEKLGTVSYYYDQQLIAKETIVLKTDLPISFQKIFQCYWYLIIGIPFMIVALIIFHRKKRKRIKSKKKSKN